MPLKLVPFALAGALWVLLFWGGRTLVTALR
jgi:hypothetical protein